MKKHTGIIGILSDHVKKGEESREKTKKKKKRTSSSQAKDVILQADTTRPTTSAQADQISEAIQAKLIVEMMNVGATIEEASSLEK